MKKIIYNITLASIFLFTFFSCDTTEPPDDDKPGRRDYIWKVDTLQIPEGTASPMWLWGVNASDVWAIGRAYLNAYQIWHFNGVKWENYVPDKYIDLRGICGFSEDNIWTGSLGTSSLPAAFWHYNGTVWTKFCDITMEGYYNVVIQSIDGSAPNNIYAVGFADSIDGQSYKAIIFHFNGSTWKQVNIPIIRNSFAQIFYDEDSGKFIIYGWTFDTINQYIYSFDNVRLKNIFTTQEGVRLLTIGKKIYAEVNIYKLLRYHNDEFEFFNDFSSSNYGAAIVGRSEKDLFTINWDGIGHYNGNDLVTIFMKWNNDLFPDGSTVFEKDIYFVWEDYSNTYIVHGELKN
jgi:hypothetical protein